MENARKIANKMLSGLNEQMRSLNEFKTELLKELTPEQKKAYAEFEQKYAAYKAAGDHQGAAAYMAKFIDENK